MRFTRPTVITVVALLLLAGAAPAAEDALVRVSSRNVGFAVSATTQADLDGDGRAEIVVVGTGGQVRVLRAADDGTLGEPLGDLVLPHPERILLAVADLTAEGRGAALVTLSPDGIRAYPVLPGGGFAGHAIEPQGRVRFTLRVGAPRLAPIVRDLNADGLPDVVVPLHDACEIWLQSRGENGAAPSFRLAATVDVDVEHSESSAADALTDVLESSFRIPDLRIADVNGDGRDDLLVEDGNVHSFHLQRADGSLPAEPDVSVDLSLFQDTTPEADVRLGRTLAGGDRQRYESRDLDGDGIPDHVITHRRKVWVFRGGPAGPQFTEPSAILKTADDITALLLVRVDADALPDLVLVRVQVPTAAGLLRGLLAEWDVDIAAVGYRGLGAKGFATTPEWRGDLTVRLPALLGVIRNPDALLRRFEAASGRFRESIDADLDGDGRADVVLVAGGDDARLDAWRGVTAAADPADAERFVGRVLFEDDDRAWTIDRLLGWLGSLAERRAAQLTGGRDPDTALALRGADFVRRGVAAADLTGNGSDELVVGYDRADDGTFVVDVLGLR